VAGLTCSRYVGLPTEAGRSSGAYCSMMGIYGAVQICELPVLLGCDESLIHLCAGSSRNRLTIRCDPLAGLIRRCCCGGEAGVARCRMRIVCSRVGLGKCAAACGEADERCQHEGFHGGFLVKKVQNRMKPGCIAGCQPVHAGIPRRAYGWA
jgi:hypothetical protein